MGVHFPTDRFPDLDRKIRLAARELAFLDTEAFVQQLLSSPLVNDQVRMLAGYLTIGETYFYREPQAWTILQHNILPPLIASRAGNSQRLRFWSAACSTGEEPYTLAMTLNEVLPHHRDWQYLILATDLNPNAIRRARAGVYSSWSFRSIAAEVRARFFHPIANGLFAIQPDVQNMVTFAEANLVSADSILNSGMMDVVFCRNVLFYFTPERVKCVLNRLYDCLVDGGWLIVSPVETTYLNEMPFVPVLIDGTTIYRKDMQHPHVPVNWSMTPQVVSPPPSVQWPPVSSPSGMPIPTPLATSENISLPVINTSPAPRQEGNLFSAPIEAAPTFTAYEEAQALYAQGQYTQVVTQLLPLCSSLEKATHFTTYESQAFMLLVRAYANQGRLTEAQTWCEKAIATDRFNPGLYYLFATILLEAERIADAIRALQKAVYVKPDFVLAHFALGNLLSQQQRYQDAKRHLSRALGILQQTPQDEILPESEGLTAGRMESLVNSMLQR